MCEDDQLPEIQTAIIGLYDILGYQNFMENTDDASLESVAAVVVKYVSMNDKIQKEFVLSKVQDEHREYFQSLMSRMRWITFSDTILTYTPYNPDASVGIRNMHWSFFMMMSAYLNRCMLEFGLPVRGIISFGKLIHAENTFAGRKIVQAHLLSKEMNLAITAFDESGKTELDRSRPFNFWDVLDYDVPLKNDKTQKLLVLNLAAPPKEHFSSLNSDLAKYFSNRFSMHNKPIGDEDVQLKIRNTVAFYEHLKKIYPEQFV